MCGTYANIWGILMVHVTIYTIHGSYGLLDLPHSSTSLNRESIWDLHHLHELEVVQTAGFPTKRHPNTWHDPYPCVIANFPISHEHTTKYGVFSSNHRYSQHLELFKTKVHQNKITLLSSISPWAWTMWARLPATNPGRNPTPSGPFQNIFLQGHVGCTANRHLSTARDLRT